MNRSSTLNSEVLRAAEKADTIRRRQLVVKLATNANAGGANITTTSVKSTTIIQQLDTFAKATNMGVYSIRPTTTALQCHQERLVRATNKGL